MIMLKELLFSSDYSKYTLDPTLKGVNYLF